MRRIASASEYAVATVSAPPMARSVSSTASPGARERQSTSTSRACGGPIVR